MAKKAYIGSNEVKGIYVGVSGSAGKVVKGYVGVGGESKQFWPPDDGLNIKIKTSIYDATPGHLQSNIKVTIKNY